MGTLLGVVAFAGPGAGDLGDPRRVVNPGVDMGPRVVVLGSEGLEARSVKPSSWTARSTLYSR